MIKSMTHILVFLILIIAGFNVQAQIWVDKDGSSFITLENERVTIFSTLKFDIT